MIIDTPMQAEQLPSEIWLYLFTFFEGHELVRTFSYLNSFFDSLLHSPHLQLYVRIRQNESNERLPESTWSHIDLQNIYSLSVGRRKANCLIQFLRWNAPYLIRLSSLSIYLRKKNFYSNIQFVIFALDQISSLKRIRIKYPAKFDRHVDGWESLMSYIFSKRFTVQKCLFISDMSNYDIITSTWSINPSLKYLCLGDMPTNNVYSILSFTPELYYLKAPIKASAIMVYENIVLTHLKKAILNVYQTQFNQLEIFKTLAPNVEYLRITGIFDHKEENFFKEQLWHELLKNIKYFHVDLENNAFNNSTITILKNYIPHFNGKSWFSYRETTYSLTLSIKYKSTTR